jgi:hypothetical protein
MASEVISGFIVNKSEPVDVRELVANQAARLAITYPYYGLVVCELDTKKVYKYITTTPVNGSIPSNIAGDWERKIQLFTGSGVAPGTLGVNDDIYIDEAVGNVYKKIAETWTLLLSISGSQILYGVGVPSGGTGNNGDSYINTTNSDLYKKITGAWVYQTNIAGQNGQSDKYATTSTTSINLGTAVAPLNLTVDLNLSYRADNDNNLSGDVVSYNAGTGALILDNLTINGAGTFTDWDVNLSGAPGKQGKAFYHVEADINFNEAKITEVEGGSWSPENLWTASVQNDTRVNLGSPAPLAGSKVGYSIAYNGTVWINNGRWLGFTGPQGLQGIQGIQGLQGIQGIQGIQGLQGLIGPQGIPGASGVDGVIPFEASLPVDASLGGGLVRYGATGLIKKWYYIDLLQGNQLIFRNGSALGAVLTVTRTKATVDGIVPPDSDFTAIITSSPGESSLNYKGRYVTSIPLSARNITFILVAQSGGIDYWKVVGEDNSNADIIPTITSKTIISTIANSALVSPIWTADALSENVSLSTVATVNNATYDNNWYWVMPARLVGKTGKTNIYWVNMQFMIGTSSNEPQFDFAVQAADDAAFTVNARFVKGLIGTLRTTRHQMSVSFLVTVPANVTYNYLRARINLQGGASWVLSQQCQYTFSDFPL